jgi:hypothetical protein
VVLQHNALKKYFRVKKFVTIKKCDFYAETFSTIFCCHIVNRMATKVSENSEDKNKQFYCKLCDYICYKKQHYNQHLLTNKHKTNEFNSVENKIVTKSFDCECGKKYKDRTGLWKHKKNCNVKGNNICETLTITPEMILNIMQQNLDFKNLLMEQTKQNQELQLQMLEVIKNGTNNTTNSHNNNNNKTFNLQFFLNEECKNAMNIGEFVSSIKMDLDDLERTGLLGYAEGISNIINKNLHDLDQTMRPIHCSDVKREVFYVKNDDQWIKENDTKPVLTKAIKQVAHENIRQISEWRKKYPDCCDPDSMKNDAYLNIVSNSMSGLTSEEQMKNYEKIISNVAKEVIIEKSL